jgi:hypothetical protein
MKTAALFAIFALTGCSTVKLSNRIPSSTNQSTVVSRPASKLHICNQYKNIFFVSVEGELTATCESFKYLDQAIAYMQVLKISHQQPFLGSIVMSQFAGWNWGTENWFAGSIEMYLKPDDTAWAKATEYIFAHEMGHLFLQAYLAEKAPLFSKLLEAQKASYQYYKYLLPILELRQSDPSCKDSNSTCSRKIQEMVAGSPVDLKGPSGDSLIAKFQADNKAQIDRFLEVVPSYHELFADLFEALYYEDPDINNPAFLGVGVPIEACRTFSAKLPADFKSEDPHCSFSSIRYELWQKFVIPSRGAKKEILLRVADAIWAELEPQLNSPNLAIEPADAAKRLLDKILMPR